MFVFIVGVVVFLCVVFFFFFPNVFAFYYPGFCLVGHFYLFMYLFIYFAVCTLCSDCAPLG